MNKEKVFSVLNKIFGRILCIFMIHDYKCVGVYHYIDTSFGCEAKSTDATFMCIKCKKIKIKRLYCAGFLSVSDFS